MSLKSLPVLMYHHVSDAPGLVTISTERFRSQMAFIKKKGWRTLSLQDVEAFFAGAPFPPRSVLITFDDGYADNFVHAFPILREFGLHATIFVITSMIQDVDVERNSLLPDHRTAKAMMKGAQPEGAILTWAEIARMRESGLIDFASHTHTHRKWNLAGADPEERRLDLKEDLSRSAAILEKRLGAPCRHLCWPWGIYDDEMIELAREAGFQYLYTVERGVNLPGTTPDEIKRFSAKEKGNLWLWRALFFNSNPTIKNGYTLLRKGFHKIGGRYGGRWRWWRW